VRPILSTTPLARAAGAAVSKRVNLTDELPVLMTRIYMELPSEVSNIRISDLFRISSRPGGIRISGLSPETHFPILQAMQSGAEPEAGWSAPERLRDRGAKRIRSHYLLPLTGKLPAFCTPLRYNAKPHSILSMPRLCAFAEQIILPRVIRSQQVVRV
jgi:hypothetical protein